MNCDGIGSGHGGRQGRRVGQADVLGRQDHQPPRDEARVLPGGDHPGQIVQRACTSEPRIDLMKRADHVVVLVAVAVVLDCRLVDRCSTASAVIIEREACRSAP